MSKLNQQLTVLVQCMFFPGQLQDLASTEVVYHSEFHTEVGLSSVIDVDSYVKNGCQKNVFSFLARTLKSCDTS